MGTKADNAHTSSDRVQRKRDRRVEQIVRTAAELFGERGYDAVNLDDVADRLDVTKGSLYYYFASKDELGTAAIETLGNDWVARLHRVASADSTTISERLRAVMREHISIAVHEYPAALGLFLVPRSWPRHQAERIKDLRRRHNAIFRSVLTDGIDAGEFLPINIDVTLQCMHAAMSQASLWIGPLDDEARSNAVEELVETLMQLTRPRERSP